MGSKLSQLANLVTLCFFTALIAAVPTFFGTVILWIAWSILLFILRLIGAIEIITGLEYIASKIPVPSILFVGWFLYIFLDLINIPPAFDLVKEAWMKKTTNKRTKKRAAV